MLDLQILCICEVLDLEEVLYLFHTLCCQVDDLVLLVYNKVSGLLDLHTHDGIHLVKLAAGLTAVHLTRKDVARLVQSGGLAALSGNDQRCTRLVDEYGIDLVDDDIVQSALYELLLIDDHVVSQVIKAQLIVGHIGNVTIVCLLAFLAVHVVQYHSHGQTEKFMHLSHPLRITLCQIVIDGDDMDALA